ncbi:hypothetical protein Y032_0267g761 [Ancylostoma ceylanicum]|uniref:Uncharacterized protein n=1 Tax=Ancylostoma ceylanicum TaxID=53326 RepID=A0A016S951_9BILA|nr:hypothetical protein Y032_0267g761 [Ancylostoma ceylanicum]
MICYGAHLLLITFAFNALVILCAGFITSAIEKEFSSAGTTMAGDEKKVLAVQKKKKRKNNKKKANKPKPPAPTNGSSNQMNGNHETVLEFE